MQIIWCLITGCEKGVVEKYRHWKDAVEAQDLRVSVGKTKNIISVVVEACVREDGKWSCVVCRMGIGYNLVMASKWGRWVYKRCCGIKGWLQDAADFRCAVCAIREGQCWR